MSSNKQIVDLIHQTFENLVYGEKSYRQVFDDFIDIIICTLSAGQMEDKYRQIAKKYKPEEIQKLSQLFAHLVQYINNHLYTDPIGEYYQTKITRGEHGQYFTPTHISTFLANGTGLDTAKTVYDPACGSGRMLLSAIQTARRDGNNPDCYGADLDSTCTKMAAINLTLHGVNGEIACLNTLTNEFFFAYKIRNPLLGVLTYITDQRHSFVWCANEANRVQKVSEQAGPTLF
jgi:type I restriction-modification system DNA methylase subunit